LLLGARRHKEIYFVTCHHNPGNEPSRWHRHMTTERILRWLPVFAAGAVLAIAGPLAWSRDFGVFLLTYFVCFPLFMFICACLVVWTITEKRPTRRRSVLATTAVVIFLVPLIFLGIRHMDRDRAAFLFRYSLHRHLVDESAATDGIITVWDSWGMAGMENDSYLVSNPSDTISSLDAASKWAQRYSDCEVVDVKRMRHGLYILTTYNCGLEQ